MEANMFISSPRACSVLCFAVASVVGLLVWGSTVTADGVAKSLMIAMAGAMLVPIFGLLWHLARVKRLMQMEITELRDLISNKKGWLPTFVVGRALEHDEADESASDAAH